MGCSGSQVPLKASLWPVFGFLRSRVSNGSMERADVHDVRSKWSEKPSSWWRTEAKLKGRGNEGGGGGFAHRRVNTHAQK